MSDMIGHNRPSFDDVVEENLRRGLLLTQRDALIRCIEDPRLQPRHRVVLAKIIKRMNGETGTAFPGRKTLSQDTAKFPGGVPDPDGGYSEQVIANAISHLVACGYLMHDRRAPKTGGRALSHYTLANPATEDLELQINSYLQAIEAKAPRMRPDVTLRSDVRIADVIHRSDVTTEGDVSSKIAQAVDTIRQKADVTTGSDVTTGVGTVTSNNNTTEIASGAKPATASRKRDAKPRTRLPEDWKPSPATIAWAKENFTASDHQIAQEAEKFYAHHFSKASKMADWPAAWRTWWFNGYHKIPRRIHPAQSSQTDRALHDAFERARLMDEEDARCRR